MKIKIKGEDVVDKVEYAQNDTIAHLYFSFNYRYPVLTSIFFDDDSVEFTFEHNKKTTYVVCEFENDDEENFLRSRGYEAIDKYCLNVIYLGENVLDNLWNCD